MIDWNNSINTEEYEVMIVVGRLDIITLVIILTTGPRTISLSYLALSWYDVCVCRVLFYVK